MRWAVRWGTIASIVGWLAAVSASPAPPGQSPHVLLITLDTMRADRIGAYGYKLSETPALDRLAREGVLFRDATTQSPLTGPAHVALLTGLYPTRLGVKDNASAPLPETAVTLAETLKARGYRTAAFIGAFLLDRQYGFAQGFDVFDATFDRFRPETKQQLQRRADQVIAPAIAWLKAAPANVPLFLWVHLYDAHAPYAAPPPFGVKFAKRPYDGEIAYVDSAVGRLLSAARERGILDRSIVVAVGDHGEALGEHGEEDHGFFLYEGVLHIPWILRLPGGERAGTVVGEQVRSVDVMPTILELAGASHEGAGRFDGESVAGVIRGIRRSNPPPSFADAHYPELHFGWSMLRSWRVGDFKYIDAPRPELYDLRTDRAEQNNVASARSNVASRMAAELGRVWSSLGAAAESRPAQPDPETLARLRSLGYVGIAAPRAGGTGGADPKDKIQDLKTFRVLISRAMDDLSAKRADAAIDKLKRAAAINERAYDLHVQLGDAWMLKGNAQNALGEYEAASLLNPQIAEPHVLAAQVALAQNNFTEALKRLDRAASIEPGSAEVAALRGRVFERLGRQAEALREYQMAVAANDSDLSTRGRLVNLAVQLGELDLAETHARVLLARKYQPATSRLFLGYIAEARGDRRTAAEEYRRALGLDPTLRLAREALARVTK